MKLGSISGRNAGLFIAGILAQLGSGLAAAMGSMAGSAAISKATNRARYRHGMSRSSTYAKGARSRYMPHQGEQEMARRRRHIAEGRIAANYWPEA